MEIEISKLKAKLLSDGRPAYVIAAKAGMHPTTLSQIASGKQGWSQKNLRKLCAYFEVDESELIGSYVFAVED